MKKAISLVLALTMVFTLAACSGGSSQPAATTAAPAATTAAATTAAATTAAATTAAAAAEGKGKIGFSLAAVSSTFNEGLRDGCVAELEALGYEVVSLVADGDTTIQASQIEDMVSQGCKGVVVFANDTDAIEESAKYCREKGVKFVEASRISPDLSNVDIAYGFDNKDQAIICADDIMAGCKEVGYDTIKVIEFVGSLTDQNAIERQDFFDEYAAQNNIEVVGKVLTEWDSELAYTRFKDAITACGGDYNAIYCASDFLYTTVMSVLSENGQWVLPGEDGYKVITGIDGAPDAVEVVRQGYVYSVCNTDVMWLGKAAADGIVDAIENGTTYSDADKVIMIAPTSITKANCDDPTIWGNNY